MGLGSLGVRYLVRGRYDSALEIFNRALLLYPENTVVPELIAETYLRQGNPERALAEIEKLPYSHRLNSLKAEYQSQVWSQSNYLWLLVGYSLLISLVFLMLLLFLKKYN